MTITVDLATEDVRTATTSPETWSHAGAASGVKGVVVAIVHGTSSTDHVSAVSYGGVALGADHVIRTTDTATESGAAEIWFLGASVPQGTQTVSYTPGATTDDIHAVCITLLGEADLVVIDTDSVSADASAGTLANPSLTLQNTGKNGTSAMAFAALYGGGAGPASFTPNANCTTVHDHDLGAFYSEVIRQTTAQTGTADFVIGGTSAADDAAFVAMSVAESAVLAADQGSFTLSGQDVELVTPIGKGGDPAPFPHLGLLLGVAGNPSLAVDHGSFALSGQDVGLTAGRTIAADQGSYALTGQDVGLTTGRTVGADHGAFALTGQSVGLIAARTLDAAYGAYALSGQDVGFTAQRTLGTDHGSFTLTGQDVSLDYNAADPIIGADYGSFTFTGQDVGLTVTRTLGVEYGAFALGGQDVGLTAGRTLATDHGSFSFSGQDVALDYNAADPVIAADYGAFALTGQDVAFNVNRVLGADFGGFTLAGQDVGLNAGRTLTVDYGGFTLTGQDVDLSASQYGRSGDPGPFPHLGLVLTGGAYSLDLGFGSFAFTGSDAELDFEITAGDGSFAFSGQDVGLTAQRTLSAAYGAFALSGQDVTLTYDSIDPSIDAGVGSFTLTGQDVGLTAQRTLGADFGSFTFSGQDVGLTVQRTLSVDYGPFTLTGQDVGLTAQRTLGVDYGSFSLTGQSVDLVGSGPALAVDHGAFALNGQDVGFTAQRTLGVEHGSFTLTGQAATLFKGYDLPSEAGAFTLTGQDVDLTLGARSLTAETGYFTLTGFGIESPTLVTDQPSGGWGWYNDAQREKARRKRLKALEDEDEADRLEALLIEAGSLPPNPVIDHRIIVREYASQVEQFNRRTQRSIDYALKAQTDLAYELAAREIANQLEDEEYTVLLLLAAA